MDITKNKITNPPSASASAMLRLRRSRPALPLGSNGSSSIASRPKRRKMKQPLHDQGREWHENIEQRNAEQPFGGGFLHVVLLAPGGEGFQQHPEAHRGRANKIEHAAQADESRRHAQGRQDQRIDQD